MLRDSTRLPVPVRLLIGVLVTLVVAGAGTACAEVVSEEFDAAQWSRHRTLGMAYGIVESSVVESMTVDEVKAMLGEPDDDEVVNGAGYLIYDLPRGLYLRVIFAGDRADYAGVEDWN